ncbi:MAG TPA: PucR family transcriptional regulator [Firmicutes bacterium]|nr:PucR family transcriptional regulator [Bacillota bacterium]
MGLTRKVVFVDYVGLQKIIDNISSLLQRPVTLEAPDGRLIAYSVHEGPVDAVRLETLLRKGASRITIDTLRERGIYNLIDSSPGLAHIPAVPDIGFASRLAMAIRDSSRVVAYLWVIGEGLTITPHMESILAAAARRLAIELANGDFSSQPKTSQITSLVADMIGNTQSEEVLLIRAESLGRKIHQPLQVMVIRPWSSHLSHLLAKQRPSLAAALETDPFTIAALIGDQLVVIVLGGIAGGCCKAINTLARQITECVPSVVAGIGRPCEVLSLVSRSYCEALRAIDIGHRLSIASPCFDYSNLAVYEILSCMSGCKKTRDFAREAVERLMVYDQLHGSNFLLTLETFIDFYGKRKCAAKKLNIHPNTLDYRMRKITELTGMNLNDPNVRFLLQLWTKALRFGANPVSPKSTQIHDMHEARAQDS